MAESSSQDDTASQTADVDGGDITAELNARAEALMVEGRYSEAEPLLIDALALRRAILSEFDLGIAESLRSLAALYLRQKRFAEVEARYDEAGYIDYVASGEHTPIYATDLDNLAELFIIRGRCSEARPLCNQAFEIRRATLPEDHPDIAKSLRNLAALGGSEAEALYKQALAICRAGLPENQPGYIKTANALALYYRRGYRDKEEEALYKEVLEMHRNSVHQNPYDIVESLRNLARTHENAGRFKKAEPLWGEVVAILLDHPQMQEEGFSIHWSVWDHVNCLYKTGKWQKAHPTLPPIYREPPPWLDLPGYESTKEEYRKVMKDVTRDDQQRNWWRFWA